MNFLLTAVQKPEDLWHFSGSFSDKPIQFHKEANVASAENDLFTIKAEFTKEKEVFVRRDTIHNHSDRPIVFHRILSRFPLDPGDYQVYTGPMPTRSWVNSCPGSRS